MFNSSTAWGGSGGGGAAAIPTLPSTARRIADRTAARAEWFRACKSRPNAARNKSTVGPRSLLARTLATVSHVGVRDAGTPVAMHKKPLPPLPPPAAAAAATCRHRCHVCRSFKLAALWGCSCLRFALQPAIEKVPRLLAHMSRPPLQATAAGMTGDQPPRKLGPGSKIAVFCGASAGNSPEYVAAAKALGEEMARRGIGLVYGGGNVG